MILFRPNENRLGRVSARAHCKRNTFNDLSLFGKHRPNRSRKQIHAEPTTSNYISFQPNEMNLDISEQMEINGFFFLRSVSAWRRGSLVATASPRDVALCTHSIAWPRKLCGRSLAANGARASTTNIWRHTTTQKSDENKTENFVRYHLCGNRTICV